MVELLFRCDAMMSSRKINRQYVLTDRIGLNSYGRHILGYHNQSENLSPKKTLYRHVEVTVQCGEIKDGCFFRLFHAEFLSVLYIDVA